MADVFISYKRDQRTKIERLATALRGLGFDVWFDASLSAGETFSEEIDREVRAASAVVVCWSTEAAASRWVKAEAQIGFGRDCLVSAYVSGDTEFEAPVPFNAMHVEDLRAWMEAPRQRDGAWLSLLRRVGELTGRPDVASWGTIGPDADAQKVREWFERHGATSPLVLEAEAFLREREAAESARKADEQRARERLARIEAENKAARIEAASDRQGLLATILYAAVAVICVFVTAWSVAQGLNDVLGALAVPVAAVIGIALFASYFSVLQNLRSGRSIIRPIALLLVMTTASAPSAFAYFYRAALGDTLAVEQLSSASATFRENIERTERTLYAIDPGNRQRDETERLLRYLRDQVNDPLSPGFGPEAGRYIEEIQRMLPERTTAIALPPAGASADDNSEWLDRFETIVKRELEVEQNSSPTRTSWQALQEARDVQRRLDDPTFRSDPALAIRLVDEQTRALEEAVNYSEAALGERTRLRLARTSSDTIRLDGMSATIQMAMARGFDAVAGVSALIALLISLLPLVLGVLLVRPGALEDRRA